MIEWLRFCAFTAQGPGSIPGPGTMIPQAPWGKTNKQTNKQKTNNKIKPTNKKPTQNKTAKNSCLDESIDSMRNLYQTWEIEINAEREIETKRVGEKAEGERRLFVCLFVLRCGVGTESVRVIVQLSSAQSLSRVRLFATPLLGRKVMTNLDSIFKSRDITLPTKVHLVKAVVFPVVMYGCESWTVKKAERRRIDAFELWCWRRLLRVPWTARRSNQSILKEINSGCSLEGLMLKLKPQSFGHLM